MPRGAQRVWIKLMYLIYANAYFYEAWAMVIEFMLIVYIWSHHSLDNINQDVLGWQWIDAYTAKHSRLMW